MTTFQELFSHLQKEICTLSAQGLHRELAGEDPPLLLDVREREEYEGGMIPAAQWIPRGLLEPRIEERCPDRGRRIVTYCASGVRSALAARSLKELGYGQVRSLEGGFAAWQARGFAVERPFVLSAEQRRRYSRHLLLPEIGEAGQAKLLQARVLCLGAGGLGSPSALYLAAAGVGKIGIVDDDVVDESNLQRQILHNVERIGQPKVESARHSLQALNPDVEVIPYHLRLGADNILDILSGYDLVIDGADNLPTRYLLNDAALKTGVKVIHASIYRFEGQVTTFLPDRGPCYRCLYPKAPSAEAVPSCQETGVLGVLPGMVGSMQANEAIKEIVGVGTSLCGRLLIFDALGTNQRMLKIKKDPNCPACSQDRADIEVVDPAVGCAVPGADPV